MVRQTSRAYGEPEKKRKREIEVMRERRTCYQIRRRQNTRNPNALVVILVKPYELKR